MERSELSKYKLPDEPGIYIFKNGRKILYVGKAASLRDRVRSYFSSDLAEGRSPAVVRMVKDADRIDWKPTSNVLEALILEANLIKRYQPPANTASRDNKSFNYLVITNEKFPRVLVVRGRELTLKWTESDIKHIFGPFPHGLQLQEAMRIVRKIFPFRGSKCVPCEEQMLKRHRKFSQGELLRQVARGTLENRELCKPCFDRQIGLCPGVCTGEMSAQEYAHTIRNIKDLFSGRFHGLKRRLAREMKAYAGSERFEEAALRRKQVEALEHIRDVTLIKNDFRIAGGGPSASSSRIEAYDTAHTSGTETVAVMTVVENGEAQKSAYRKFKIRSATNDDVAALKEVLSRRLGHPEWPLPRVIAVDGGKAQMNAATKLLKEIGLAIPLVGVVKNEFHKPERLIGDVRAIRTHERDILLANNEAHRFAITWHRKRRGKLLV